jgi:Peptidase_C39 like family
VKTEISLDIQAQPNDETCGATCLHALYRFYGVENLTVERLAKEIGRLPSGGTLAEVLGCHALERGFNATIYTYHLQMFDPTWFASDGEVHDPDNVIFRLREQIKLRRKPGMRLRVATRAFVNFLELGGQLKLEDLTPGLVSRYLCEGVPIITGLSSTFLYRESRELSPSNVPDDVRGEPQGHFVMLVGYDSERREVVVADPLDVNPPFYTNKYRLDVDRLVNAILLGAFTHDANLLVITPKSELSHLPARRKAAPSNPPPKERGTEFAKPRHKPVSKPTSKPTRNKAAKKIAATKVRKATSRKSHWPESQPKPET